MSAPRVTTAPKVVAVTESSPAALSGIRAGDEFLLLNGRSPRDVIEYSLLVDEPDLDLVVRRPGLAEPIGVQVHKEPGEPLGVEVSSAVFDRVRTCDNHCEFCFIHQLPKGLRRSLYTKDDDYRLSFLYGNFTTLTRFTELDAERVLEERLSPLFVSIHATDPEVRAAMLRNPKGATSLRWLRVLLEGGIEIHGQVVVCPGVNDGDVLEDTLVGILDQFPTLASVGVVPLGLSRFSHEPDMRPHTRSEALAVCEAIARWQALYQTELGRRLVYASDEYYLMAGLELPPSADYDGFPQHENGIGIVRAFEERFEGDPTAPHGVRAGFFAAVDGAPPEGYRAVRSARVPTSAMSECGNPPIGILTGSFAAPVISALVGREDTRGGSRPPVRVIEVTNEYFGGTIGVAGLLTGSDLRRVLASEPHGHRYLLPDVCLSEGRFLDGLTPEDLPRPVEIVATDGRSLRAALDGEPVRSGAGSGATP
jgi:putative radical SAM enzyme (TIGR03279 family)